MSGTNNNFPGIGYKTQGRDYNYFQNFTVTNTAFGSDSIDGYQPTAFISFSTESVTFQLASASSGVLQYSFNGQTVHGDMTVGQASASLTFLNRPISLIWFRVVSGSATVRVEAWGTR